jgi:hypothetical protein
MYINFLFFTLFYLVGPFLVAPSSHSNRAPGKIDFSRERLRRFRHTHASLDDWPTDSVSVQVSCGTDIGTGSVRLTRSNDDEQSNYRPWCGRTGAGGLAGGRGSRGL